MATLMDFLFSGESFAFTVPFLYAVISQPMDAMQAKQNRFTDAVGELIATFFYIGKLPKAPGTMGSLAALPLAWFVWFLPHHWAWFVLALVFLVGSWSASVVIRKTGTPDHSSIVIDEVLGILFCTSITAHLWWQYLLAFLLFRIFDIWKPWPVRWVDQKWKGPFGAMLDDVVAAAIATGILFIILRYSFTMVSLGTA